MRAACKISQFALYGPLDLSPTLLVADSPLRFLPHPRWRLCEHCTLCRRDFGPKHATWPPASCMSIDVRTAPAIIAACARAFAGRFGPRQTELFRSQFFFLHSLFRRHPSLLLTVRTYSRICHVSPAAFFCTIRPPTKIQTRHPPTIEGSRNYGGRERGGFGTCELGKRVSSSLHFQYVTDLALLAPYRRR